MRAMEIGDDGTGLDRLRPVTLADPGAPGPGEIRVRLHASSLNFHDLGVANGRIPTVEGRIPLADGAGVVEEVGPGVREFYPGDHVVSTFFSDWLTGPATMTGFGSVPGDGIDGYAREVVLAPPTFFTRAPMGYRYAEAATVTTAGVTAWRALVVDAQVKPDQTVLVLGTGGVSIFALQLALALGAQVIVTSSSAEKLRRVRRLGATHTVNYTEQPEWGRAVLELTDGVGVDCVVEVGGMGTISQSLQAVALGGFVSVIGGLTGFGAPFDLRSMLFKQVRMQGLIVGSREHQQRAIAAFEEYKICPVIDRTFALEELREAFEYQQSGAHFGKVCVEW
jgi:NADPH:quinone reductase-like Zn-dependent oxidoreductase